MESKNLTPISILAGSAIIGAGLFFGLRYRTEPSTPTQAAGPPPIATPPLAPPPTIAPPTIPTAQALQNIKLAFQAEKTRSFTPKCWEPALKKQPEPAKSKYVIATSFNAEGTEIMRGVNEERGVSRPDVAQCLRQLPIGLTIPAPGTIINTEVPVEFP